MEEVCQLFSVSVSVSVSVSLSLSLLYKLSLSISLSLAPSLSSSLDHCQPPPCPASLRAPVGLSPQAVSRALRRGFKVFMDVVMLGG